MIWQFGEYGYDVTIEQNGRTGQKPIRWQYLNDWRRKYLFNVYAALIDLKKIMMYLKQMILRFR